MNQMSARSNAGMAMAVSAAARKRPRTGRVVADDEEVEKDIWMDSDALSVDCGLCYMPFEAQVYMCKNGHAACADCCVRTNGRCWCCGEPIGDIRCRPLENVLAEMNTLCKFAMHGCTEVVKYVEKRKHEETCPRAPCSCPVDGCAYRGANLYGHLLDHHHDDDDDAVAAVAYLQAATVTLAKGTPFRVLVMVRGAADGAGGEGSVFLLLNGGGGGLLQAGRSLSLVCLGPRSEGEISYKMEVRVGGEPGAGAGALSLAGTAPCVRELEGFEAKVFLVVPEAVWEPSGSVSVSIRIG